MASRDVWRGLGRPKYLFEIFCFGGVVKKREGGKTNHSSQRGITTAPIPRPAQSKAPCEHRLSSAQRNEGRQGGRRGGCQCQLSWPTGSEVARAMCELLHHRNASISINMMWATSLHQLEQRNGCWYKTTKTQRYPKILKACETKNGKVDI